MIYGIGIDIIHHQRIEKVLQRYPLLFPQKILTALELREYPHNIDRQINFLSKRFAAKEAFAKALGTGFGKNLYFHDIEIFKNEHGQPYYKYAPRLSLEYPIAESFLSIADDSPQVIAFCILSKTV
jgi:holo-[acyl-carrier protein] synthase